MKRLFRGGQVVTADGVRAAGVLTDGPIIIDADAPPTAACDEVIDCTGRYVMPGVVDDQVHFREPGLTHKEDLASASRACAAGGMTSFLEMPNTRPPAVTVDGVHAKQRLAAEKSLVNYGFYIGATPDNVDELVAADDDPTIPGIKIFIGSSTGNLLVDGQDALEAIFERTRNRICAHCEDETTVRENAARYADTTDVADHSRIRDHAAAVIATRRAIDLSTRHKHPFHVLHVSTADEIPIIASAPDWVTAEVCHHHLFFNVDDYDRLGTRIQMNPSLKTADDNAALWRALHGGPITVIATDHAPHTLEEKSASYPASPSGLPAVENALRLMLDRVAAGRCTLPQIAAWMCRNPADVWRMDRKGRIAEGYDADLVVVDMERRHTIRDSEQHTKCRWSPWDGVTVTGSPVRTVVRGRTVWDIDNGFADIDPTTDRQLTFRA